MFFFLFQRWRWAWFMCIMTQWIEYNPYFICMLYNTITESKSLAKLWRYIKISSGNFPISRQYNKTYTDTATIWMRIIRKIGQWRLNKKILNKEWATLKDVFNVSNFVRVTCPFSMCQISFSLFSRFRSAHLLLLFWLSRQRRFGIPCVFR